MSLSHRISLVLIVVALAAGWPARVTGFTWSCFPNSLDWIGGPESRVEVGCAQAPPSGPTGRAVRRFALPLSDPMAPRLARVANLARANGMVLLLAYDLGGGDAFAGCEPAGCRRLLSFGVARQGVGSATCPIYNPLEGADSLTGFCTAACPCQVGQGDCDGHDECAGGARCANDVGGGFGLPDHFDVCLPAGCVNTDRSPIPGQPDCWRLQDEAGAQESDCAPTLFLFAGKCRRCPGIIDPTSPHMSLCSAACPCPAEVGHCNSDRDCRGGGKVQKCVAGAGPRFGLPSHFGVCLPIYRQ